MSAAGFLIALAALSIGTYVMRFAGVKLGGAIATKGERRRVVPVPTGAGSDDSNAAPGDESEAPTTSAAGADGGGDSTSRATMWMDRATVVLIGAVFATTAVFDGQDIADPARLIGVGVGVLASILRVPMLLCVFLGMGVCAIIRMTGVL